MGYFDGLTDASFKTDDEGRFSLLSLWYFGKGYILPDELKNNKLDDL